MVINGRRDFAYEYMGITSSEGSKRCLKNLTNFKEFTWVDMCLNFFLPYRMGWISGFLCFLPVHCVFSLHIATGFFVEANSQWILKVGIRGKNCVVIGVEKKTIPTLQDDRTIRKIHSIDEHVMLAFAGKFANLLPAF